MDDEVEKLRKKKMEELLRKENSPKAKVKEFARAIVKCEEYKNFIKSSEKLNKDTEAQNLLKRFQEKQMELRWNGFGPNTLEELRDLQMKINKNDTIQKFVNAQQELVDILRRTNEIISEKIGTQFAFFQGGSCCG